MCGLVGALSTEKLDGFDQILKGMAQVIEHRGPDDSGVYVNDKYTVGLAHRRLSIQDLSALGHQPMASKTGQFVIVYNGEIYNFKTLKEELVNLGCSFSGDSDTEVLLACIELWGIAEAIKRCHGMFAIAVYDKKENQVTLARDRLGEKPLYYSFQKNALLFASELKSLKAYPNVSLDIDRNSLALLIRHNCIPAPYSIYKNTFKLKPGHLVTIDVDNIPDAQSNMDFQEYWSIENSVIDNSDLSFNQAVEHTENLLIKTIEQQMVSDAPLGAFLSGGVDSSTVVALMQKISTRKVQTFSIGFKEEQFNEAEHAKSVASFLNTEHSELYISGNDALELIPKMANVYDEPFADSSQLPTYLLCEMAKKDVTVALSGDGGDELFCGYSRYFQFKRRWDKRETFKESLKKATLESPLFVQKSLSKLINKPSRFISEALLEAKLAKEKLLHSQQFNSFYKAAVSVNSITDHMVIDEQPYSYGIDKTIPSYFSEDEFKSMMFMDLNWYLPDDILVKVDRAAMANSLETRVPMLDHKFVEFALSLPTRLNIQNGTGKHVLRSTLYKHVPKELIERPKVGFAIPIDHWLRNELKDWAHTLLAPKLLQEQGYFHEPVISSMLEAHMKGVVNYGYQLWGVLMFQQWLLHE